MFGQLGFGEILMIMVVILLLFGAKRIPEVAALFGKGIKEFKKNINDVTHEVTTPPRADTLRSEPPAHDRWRAGGRRESSGAAPADSVVHSLEKQSGEAPVYWRLPAFVMHQR